LLKRKSLALTLQERFQGRTGSDAMTPFGRANKQLAFKDRARCWGAPCADLSWNEHLVSMSGITYHLSRTRS
jgi:hypothetical protein